MDQFTVVTSGESLGQIAQEISQADVVGIDLETVGKTPLKGQTRIFSVNTRKGIYVIDLFKTKTLGPIPDALRDSVKCVKILQNAKFDQKFLLHEEDLELWPLFDTYRAAALLTNGREISNDLWSLFKRELNVEPSTEDLGGSDWRGELTEQQYKYAAEDVIYLPALREKLRAKIMQAGLAKIALIEFGAVVAESSVELNGFALDQERWRTLAVANGVLERKLRDELRYLLPPPTAQMGLPGMGSTLNPDSPDQILACLKKLGFPEDNTREMTLAQYASKIPQIDRILAYRDVSKKCSSFGEDYLKWIDPQTAGIHADFFPFTGAGRYSCSHPNLQQIPRDKEFRRCFRARPGYVLILADYSGIEMRIVAEIANDKKLIEVFRQDKDAHKRTAAIINNIPESQVTKDQRQKAKPVNFGFIYGMQPPKLVLYAKSNYGVTLSQSEAEGYKERYFEEYSGIAGWHQRAIRDAQRQKCAWTIGGRLRFLDPQTEYNAFFNTPVQGSGADALKASLRNVYMLLKKYGKENARMVHHVHDEIISEVKNEPDLIEGVKKDLNDGMFAGMAQFLSKVPVVVEPSQGDSWADAKG